MEDASIPFHPKAFEREVESALIGASVYDIGSYGWLNEYDADPDFIGHAMWQIDQPSLDEHALFGEAPVRRRPQEIEKEILTAGEDFCGLMQISRLSIGLTLLWQRRARANLWSETTFFWLHHTDAFLKLAIASDRLRDLLTIACSGLAPKVYKDLSARNRKFVTPFKNAHHLLAARGLEDKRLREPLAVLPGLASELLMYIRRRNTIVHEVATRMARSMRDSVSELQRRYDDEQKNGFSARSSMEWFFNVNAADASEDELRAEIDRAANELRDWYTLLIRTSNCVFQVEYWSRVLGPTLDPPTE
jgi:hypothetical protein